jgi:hypothetical protein
MLLAALRRFLVLLVLAAGVTVAGSLLLGVLTGAPPRRAASVGLYLVGSFLLVAGFFFGNRGPVRLRGDDGVPLLGSRIVRWASPAEREEAINTSAIFVVLGFVLVLLGVVADDRYTLV